MVTFSEVIPDVTVLVISSELRHSINYCMDALQPATGEGQLIWCFLHLVILEFLNVNEYLQKEVSV